MAERITRAQENELARQRQAEHVYRHHFTANGSTVCPECREVGTVELGYENADCSWCGADVWRTFEPVL